MVLALLLLVLLLLLAAAAAGALWVDRVFDWSLSVDGFLNNGKLGLLGQVTGLLDLEAESLSQGTLHVDGPFRSILLSADALEGAMLVLGFEGSLKPLLLLLWDLHFLFLGGGAGAAGGAALLLALAALGRVGGIIISLLVHLDSGLDFGNNDKGFVILGDHFDGAFQSESSILIRQPGNSNKRL